MDQPIQLPSFSEEVTFAEEVLRLGRDNMLDLRITYGRAAYQNPDIDERYHYMYFDCADDDNDDEEVIFIVTRLHNCLMLYIAICYDYFCML